MTDRTVIVTGATGLLGREVVRAFDRKKWVVKGAAYSRADGISTTKIDLNDADQVGSFLDQVKPQVVVHCAANRFPDKVDKDPEAAKNLNVNATRQLSRLCAANNVILLYISTDYVFSGKPGEAPYDEGDTPAPTNLYGQTKLEGELALFDEFKKAGKSGSGIVLRVPVLYGDAEVPEESAVNVLMNSVWKVQEEGAKVKMDHWSLRYPTNTEDVARVCSDIAAKYLDAEDRSQLPPILQFSSEDKFTKYEICQAFGEIMGLDVRGIEPVTEGNDPNAAVQRPYDCHLSTKALQDLGIPVATMSFVGWWRRAVHAFRR